MIFEQAKRLITSRHGFGVPERPRKAKMFLEPMWFISEIGAGTGFPTIRG
jgi:hypothetical protein